MVRMVNTNGAEAYNNIKRVKIYAINIFSCINFKGNNKFLASHYAYIEVLLYLCTSIVTIE